MKVLFIGDIFGNPGRKAVKELLSTIKREEEIDICIANSENAAGGSGLTNPVAQELFKTGIDGMTLGNHTWSKREILNFIDSEKNIVRPANFSEDLPGQGSAIITNKNGSIGIVNVQGRVFMDASDCPFKAAKREVEKLKKQVKIVIVDMHAEASSEKCALAWFLDGTVSAVLGTHTHVQTADERILDRGTAYITDVGMTGPYDGIIGVDKDIIVNRFLTNMPERFEVAKGRSQFNAVVMSIDEKTGRCIEIKRINNVLPE